jgi:malate dehydrogenase
VRANITVVGAGNVGATLCQRLAERNYADLTLVDIVEGLAEGKALDILESGPIVGYDSNVTGVTVADSTGWERTANSDFIIVTSGIARKPGMSRDDLLLTNAKIVSGVVRNAAKHSPNAILIVVSNPLDAMAQVAMTVSGFPRERVIGMAGVLDTARFRTFLAQETGASVTDVAAYVLGGHGDSMVPLTGLTTVGGVPVGNLISAPRLEEIVQRARSGGAEIVALLKTGSAFYAPSAAAAQMVDAIVGDTRAVLPCAAYLTGEYGIDGLFTGVPCRLGAGGLIEVVEVPLSAAENSAVRASAEAVRELVTVIDGQRPELGIETPLLKKVAAA